jgi:hypothetical protein
MLRQHHQVDTERDGTSQTQTSPRPKRDSVPLCRRLPRYIIVRLILSCLLFIQLLQLGRFQVVKSDIIDWMTKSESESSNNNWSRNSPSYRSNHLKTYLNAPGPNPYTRISFQLNNPDIVPYPAKFFNCLHYLCNGNDTLACTV